MIKQPLPQFFTSAGLNLCLRLLLLLAGIVSLLEAAAAESTRSFQTIPVTVVTGHEASQVIGRWVYDSEGRLLRVTDDVGRTTRFRHDEASGAVAAEDSFGQTLTLAPVYDADGQLIETVGSNGWRAQYRYDPEGRWIATAYSNGAFETVDYHERGFTVTLTPIDDVPLRFEHDAYGRLVKTVDAFRQETVFHYDTAGRLIGETTPTGEVTRYAYRQAVHHLAQDTAAAASEAKVTAAAGPVAAMRATITLPSATVTASGYSHPVWDMYQMRLAMGYVPRIGGYILGRGMAAKRVIYILRPGGKLIGKAGSSSQIRIIKGGQSEADALFKQLSKSGQVVKNKNYPGTLVRLPDGGTVGLRPVSKSGPPTIDVNVVGLGIREIKFRP